MRSASKFDVFVFSEVANDAGAMPDVRKTWLAEQRRILCQKAMQTSSRKMTRSSPLVPAMIGQMKHDPAPAAAQTRCT